MPRPVVLLLALPAALLMSAITWAGPDNDDAGPTPFQKDEGSWVAGFLNPQGAIVVRPQHDLATISPFADLEETSQVESASFVAASAGQAPDDAPEAEAPSAAGLASGMSDIGDLAVNVPDLPHIIDRMGTAVLILSVCLVAALIYRKRMVLRGRPLKSEPRMRVVSRMPVSRRGEVCLVEIDRRLMVVGLDAQGIRTLVPLDAASPPNPTFAEIQDRAMSEAADVSDLEASFSSSPPPLPQSALPRPPVRRRPASLLGR